MNTPFRRSHRSDSGASASGFVLVTVLIVMVLVVVLVVAFLLRVTTEQTSATGFRGSASARELADMAVGLVQGQIGLATSQGSTNVWVSQPGMVRTYDQSGNLLNAYKLYSSTNMIVPGSTGLGISGGASPDAPATTWANDVAFWTDLNAPVQTPNGTNVYPIVDPGALNATTGPAGFSVSSAPGATVNQPIPMPVRWLYVLENGSLVAPTGSGTTATVAGESSSNKIVGRIAFWTDDDSCRVNINTASTGTFWDVPRAYSTNASGVPTAGSLTQEQAFGYYQPVQKEFQRYPGHPAMTDLRSVFPSLSQTQIYNIVPRVVGGGSTQGTVQVPTGSVLTGYPKNNRLYADVDELLFTPSRGVNTGISLPQLQTAKFFLTAQSRAPEVNLFGYPRIACWPINADYNPVTNPTSSYTTAFDRLIATCSTIGNMSQAGAYYPYYFQRQNALSTTSDISIPRNQTLYSYLQYLTSRLVPGFGTSSTANFLAKYPSPDGVLPSDRDQILTEIFDYIRCINLYDDTLDASAGQNKFEFTGTGVTGTNAIGYVAPSVNGTVAGATTTVPMGFGRYNTLSQMGIGFICNADGNYAPSNIVAVVGTKGGNRVLGGTALSANQKYIQAILIPEFFSAMHGYVSMMPNMQITMSGLSNLQVNGQQLFPNDTEGPVAYDEERADGSNPILGSSASYSTGVASIYGANPGWRYFGLGQTTSLPNKQGRGRIVPARGNLPADKTGASELYPFVGTPIQITDTAGTMSFTSSGDIKVVISVTDPVANKTNIVQTINIKFPGATFPTPKIVTNNVTDPGPNYPGPPVVNYTGLICSTVHNNSEVATEQETWWGYNALGVISDGNAVPVGAGTVTTNLGTIANTFGRLTYVGAPPTPLSSTLYAGVFLRPDFDVLRTVMPPHGDFRLVGARNYVPDTVFQPEANYSNSAMAFASQLSNSANTSYDPGYDKSGQYISSITSLSGHEPQIATGVAGTVMPQATGDYDDSLPDIFPGPFINKPNEGAVAKSTSTMSIPYYASVTQTTANGQGGVDANPDGGAFFSPNRMMPSPGMFGSLPTGVMAGKPWQTLLFRPQPAHPGAVSPADHLLLDLFWMPVVEPYAISDRFSTAGKINMNYQILPFTYMTRSTGLNALFKSEMVMAIPNTVIAKYKVPGGGTNVALRNVIDPAQTLAEFQSKFSGGDVFKSASEICNIDIVPVGQTDSTIANSSTGPSTFWQNNALTGDNDRERIYTTLYPRLTTKSNTYTVYFVAQSLKKAATSAYGTWTEGTDIVQGEYRGSAKIERFIDANNTAIPDYAADASAGAISGDPTLDTFYRWRVISNRQFAP